MSRNRRRKKQRIHLKQRERQPRVYWPRELEILFGESTSERVRVAASSASTCSACGQELGNEDRSYECMTPVLPAQLRALASGGELAQPVTATRVVHWISHARCKAPHIRVGAVEPPPDLGDSIWRTGFITREGYPGLLVQPSFDSIERHRGGENLTAWVSELAKRGFQWLRNEEDIDANVCAVGTSKFDATGAFSVHVDDFQIIDGDLRDCGEKEAALWRQAVTSLGGFLLISGTGMHLPIEGDIDLGQALRSGKLYWGWIDATVVASAASM